MDSLLFCFVLTLVTQCSLESNIVVVDLAPSIGEGPDDRTSLTSNLTLSNHFRA